MKRILLIASVIVVLALGIAGTILYNNRTASTITLDINPSIKINLDRKDRVKDVIALNDDAKEIIDRDFEGKSLDDALNVIASNIIEKGYTDETGATILLYSTGKVNNRDLEEKLRNSFGSQNIGANVIVIEKITKEDEKLASKYNITPAKAAYINQISKENNIDVENLVDESVRGLDLAKQSGNYCEKGYNLEGDRCLKEIDRKPATTGNVCTNGYLEYNGTCYEETPFEETNTLICNEEYVLEGTNCIKTTTVDAKANYSCSKGELMRKSDVNPIGAPDNDKYYCVDKSSGKSPVLRCLNNKGHIMINGKCYNGPAPLINGGCPNNDVVRNGGCYSKDDEDQWECPNGNIYSKSKGGVPELCPDTLTYIQPNIDSYSCEEGFALKGDKCVKEEIEEARKQRVCKSGYTMIESDRCINKNKTASTEKGYVCEYENSKLKGNECIIYDVIDAKHN